MGRDPTLDAGGGENLDARQWQPAFSPDLGSASYWGIELDAHGLAVDPFDDRGLSADVLGSQVFGLDDYSNCQFVGGGSFHTVFAGFFDPA